MDRSFGGLIFAGVVTPPTVVLVALKLTGVIDWGWWWVMAPLWGGMVLFLVVIVFLAIVVTWGERE